MDPLDAITHESRDKLLQLHNENSSTSSRKRKRKGSLNHEVVSSSLKAVDKLLADVDDEWGGMVDGGSEAEEFERRERNKRFFPDTKTIDPYDPTTYGYVELGRW